MTDRIPGTSTSRSPGTGFCREARNSQSAAGAIPVAPHRCCWATSPHLLLPSPFHLFYTPSPLTTTSGSLSPCLRRESTVPLLHLQNVCSCCFLRHLQGGQRRMLFEPCPVVVIFLVTGKIIINTTTCREPGKESPC